MAALSVLLLIVAIAVASAWFGADTRPGIDQPQQAWFGQR